MIVSLKKFLTYALKSQIRSSQRENNSTGFGDYPMTDVSFGGIPTDSAFDSATDGRGMIITASTGASSNDLNQYYLHAPSYAAWSD